MVPMQSLGQDSWKIAAALMGRHIGGAVNYVAIADALQVFPSVLGSGLAADNVICAVYFTTLFALASKIPPKASSSTSDVAMNEGSENGGKLPVLQTTTALAVSFAICKAATHLTKYFGIKGGSVPAITAIIFILATEFPSQFGRLAPTTEAIALILMQILERKSKFAARSAMFFCDLFLERLFFTVVGASRNIWNVINTAPSIFVFALVQIVFLVFLQASLGLPVQLFLAFDLEKQS